MTFSYIMFVGLSLWPSIFLYMLKASSGQNTEYCHVFGSE